MFLNILPIGGIIITVCTLNPTTLVPETTKQSNRYVVRNFRRKKLTFQL